MYVPRYSHVRGDRRKKKDDSHCSEGKKAAEPCRNANVSQDIVREHSQGHTYLGSDSEGIQREVVAAAFRHQEFIGFFSK
jgi:hypothetical protein